MGLQVAIDPAKEPRKPQARVTWSDSPSQQVSYSREKKLQKWYEGERSRALLPLWTTAQLKLLPLLRLSTKGAAAEIHKRSSGRDASVRTRLCEKG